MDPPCVKYRNKCCVSGCKDKASRRHRFPNPKKELEMMHRWVDTLNVPKLREMTPAKIYDTCFVCERHFAQQYLVSGSRRGLSRDAIPTLCLSAISEEDEEVEKLVEGVVEGAGNGSEKGNDLPQNLPEGNSVACAHAEPALLLSTADSTAQCPPNVMDDTIMQHPDIPSTSKSTAVTRRGILQEVNVTRQKDLTPKCKKFYKKAIEWCRNSAKLNYKINSLQSRLANAEKASRCPNFEKLIESVNPATYTFILQQIKNQKLTPRARRFTLEEKILSLTLFKGSAKGYRLLSRVFCLPSPKTLTNMLNKIPLRPGLNQQILESLKRSVSTLKENNDKLCAVIFDEMSITPLLSYNQKFDCIDGVEDFGNLRSGRIANYANVFLIKGIKRQWKQPISFTFSSGPTKSFQLKKMIREVIQACQKVGLQVVATVCDQGSANRAAINALLKETTERCKKRGVENHYFGFLVGGQEIVPLYDVPHLFKGIRNNLLKHQVYFEQHDGTMKVKKLAKWSHIEQLYLLDTNDTTRLLPSLTDAHIYPGKMNKMKVSLMTQVFSHSVGALMKRTAQWNIQHEYNLPAEAVQTADFILLMDQLFDSLNGNALKPPSTKPLKGGITATSDHERFWREAIEVLESMRFWYDKKNEYRKVPSTINLIKTIKGFIYLKSRLLKSMQYILPRAFNQDCIENFFAAVRTHGRRNTSPDVVHFTASFKSLLINNFMSTHSPGANCEEDFSAGALDNLQCFITGEEIAGIQCLNEPLGEVPSEVLKIKRTPVAKATTAYFAGFIGKKIMIKNKQCVRCFDLLTHSDGNVPLDVIEARQYSTAQLQKPGSFLYFVVSQALSILFYCIPRQCHKKKLAALLQSALHRHLNFKPLNCEVHTDVELLVCKLITKYILFFWCKQVNRILLGKDEKFVRFLKSKPNPVLLDPIKLQAHKMYLRVCKFKKQKQKT